MYLFKDADFMGRITRFWAELSDGASTGSIASIFCDKQALEL